MKGLNRRLLLAIASLMTGFAGLGIWPAGAAGQGSGGPAVSLSPPTLNFPSQVATTTSAPQTSTLKNVGGQALTITSVVLDGSFSQTNTCPTSGSLAPAASCAFTVTFMAPNGGPTIQPGFIEINDNAPPGLQVISLGGTVADFTLAAASTSATVTAGSSASYALTATASGGFNQAVSFSCGALPTGAGCSFSPSSLTPGTSPTPFTLTVSTTAGSAGLGRRPRGWPIIPPGAVNGWILGLMAAGLTGLFALLKRARAATILLIGFVAIGISLAVACGGGGGSSSGGGSVATPKGTYTVLVTGTPTGGPSSLKNPLILTLVVN